MEYFLEVWDEAVNVRVDGRVDEATWEAFGAALGQAVQQADLSGLQTVIINLAELDYMSSRGLRALTVAKRQADQSSITIVLESPNEVMSEILAISRYDKLFTITGAAGAKQ